MSIDPYLISNTLGSVSQTVATILSIYLALFTFTLIYLWKKIEHKRNTARQRRRIILWISSVSLIIVFLAYLFIYPSRELGLINYTLISLIVLYNFVNLYIFIKTRNYNYLEIGIALFSSLFLIASLILGFYLIFSSLSVMVNAIYLESTYIFKIIKFTRLFLVLILISAIYLISSIVIHKLLISKD